MCRKRQNPLWWHEIQKPSGISIIDRTSMIFFLLAWSCLIKSHEAVQSSVRVPQVTLDKVHVNHYIPTEQSSARGHCIRRREILSCFYECVCVVKEFVFMDSCIQSSTVLVCNQLVRRTNFLLHLFTGSLQLKQGLERGLHSDINSDRAGRKSPPHWETTHLDCVHLCVCVWL